MMTLKTLLVLEDLAENYIPQIAKNCKLDKSTLDLYISTNSALDSHDQAEVLRAIKKIKSS